jgi:3-oxoacyl-[acyl-carrier-protein] synthase II
VKKIFISGTGAVTPIGTGNDQFWNNAAAGISGIRMTGRFASLGDIRCGEIKGDMEEYVTDRRFRRIAEISKYALAAAGLAIKDADPGMAIHEDTALIMGITHGALNYTQEFHGMILREGGGVASPLLFADSVLNSSAGNASIYFGIKGPVHTLIGGPEVSIKSIILACRMIREGQIRKALVVSSEELNELSYSYNLRKGNDILAEGAGALLIDCDDATEAPYRGCFLSGMASGFDPSDPEGALNNVMTRSLQDAALNPGEIDFIMTDVPMSGLRRLKGKDIPSGSVKLLTGDAFSVTAIWHIILAAIALRKGILPAGILAEKGKGPYAVNNIMICSLERQGSASAVILSGRS